jgi:hypothetical protein
MLSSHVASMDFAAALAVLQQRSSAPASSSTGPTASESGLIGEPRCAECVVDGELPPAPLPVAPGSLAALGTGVLLRRFLERQQERVGVYRRFEEGFVLFLQVAEADGYQALVKQTTEAFTVVSAAVNELETVVRERGAGAHALADAIRKVQTLEREKLQLTAQLHIVRHGLALDALFAEHADAGGGGDGDDSQTQASEEGAASGGSGGVAYAVGGTGGSITGSGGGAGGARARALRVEESESLSRRLSEVTTVLNETLDEIRCELADLEEEEEE